MARRSKFSQELRERAVRMVLEHRGQYASQWEAIRSISEKICCSAEGRPTQAEDEGEIVAVPILGGLHHRYERRRVA